MHSLLAVLFVLSLRASGPVPPQHFERMRVHAPKAELSLEIADTQSKREYGLMNRTHLIAHTGMVFVFDQDGPVAFWMKNTLIPLDMVFVGADGRVRSVSANVPASTLQTPDTKVARRTGNAKYVVELAAREAAADGLVPGCLIPELHR